MSDQEDSDGVNNADLVTAGATEVLKRRFVGPVIEKERNVECRGLTSTTLDDEQENQNRNVLLPLDSLIVFLEENFMCKICRRSIKRSNEDGQQTPLLGLEVFGLACGLNFSCDCGAKASLRPRVVPEAKSKLKSLQDGNPYAMRVNAGNFEINRRFVLGLQLCGRGRQDGKILSGMLNLNVNPMRVRFTQIQEQIGMAIIKVAEEVLEENLGIECALSPMGVDGRGALDVASDTRWDKRGSSRRYDSLSGCAIAFGLRSALPIGIEPMSSVCIKCTKGTDHDKDVCSKNYKGSSKGMEASGAVKIVTRLFEDWINKCYVCNLVTNDDSSVRKILTHSYKELIDACRMTEAVSDPVRSLSVRPPFRVGSSAAHLHLLPIDSPFSFFRLSG